MWSPILGQRIGDHLYPDFRGFKYIPSKISIEKLDFLLALNDGALRRCW